MEKSEVKINARVHVLGYGHGKILNTYARKVKVEFDSKNIHDFTYKELKGMAVSLESTGEPMTTDEALKKLISRYAEVVENSLDNRSREIIFEMLVRTKSWLEKTIDIISEADPEPELIKSFEKELEDVEKALQLAWKI